MLFGCGLDPGVKAVRANGRVDLVKGVEQVFGVGFPAFMEEHADAVVLLHFVQEDELDAFREREREKDRRLSSAEMPGRRRPTIKARSYHLGKATR